MELLNKTIDLFYQNADANNANAMSKYMRNLFDFLGISKPLRATLQKTLVRELTKEKQPNWEIINLLWNKSEREFQYLAIDILNGGKYTFAESDLRKIRFLITNKSWWDTVDLIAGNCLGKIITQHPKILQNELKQWITDENLWIRRSSIICQLKFKERTNKEFLTEAILKNADSDEFFINKAIGWALREYSKTNPAWVKDFLSKHKLSPLSVKEGNKYIKKMGL